LLVLLLCLLDSPTGLCEKQNYSTRESIALAIVAAPPTTQSGMVLKIKNTTKKALMGLMLVSSGD